MIQSVESDTILQTVGLSLSLVKNIRNIYSADTLSIW